MTAAAGKPAGRLRATAQAARLHEVLSGMDGFRSAQELHAEAKRRNLSIGLATVYRNLHVMVQADEVDVLHLPNGEARYRLCLPTDTADADHHHHVVCRQCGRSESVQGQEVEAWAQRMAEVAGFTEITHTAEIFGLCPEHSSPDVRRAPRRRPPGVGSKSIARTGS